VIRRTLLLFGILAQHWSLKGEDEYDVSATTIEEDQQLLKAGFEYVTERNGIKLYRRPKIFSKLMTINKNVGQ